MPTTRYARSGDVNIAYQVLGEGPRNLVYVPGWISNVEVVWEEPGMASFLRRLASFSRLIIFDKRGTGMSDAVSVNGLPTLEERMDDVRAVMDEVGAETASLLGHSEGGNMCSLFAASNPERTDGLVLVGSYAKRIRSTDYPWAPTREERDKEIAQTEERWGDPELARELAPSRAADEAFQAWMARYARLSASPRAAASLLRMNSEIDTTAILRSIRVPTLCIYRTGDQDVSVDEGRYIASLIPGARFVELPGVDHWLAAGETDAMLTQIEEFVTGHRALGTHERVLATVLITDIAGSTELASGLGDRRWRELLERHDRMVAAEIGQGRGKVVKGTGDGVLATFDGPARGIRTAEQIIKGANSLGLKVRAGLHTGEIELVGDDIAGVAVHLAARVSNLAGPNEILVSRTVRDLVAGSGLEFENRGEHELKGIPESWDIFAVVPVPAG